MNKTALNIACAFAAITALLESWNVGGAGSLPHHIAIWALGAGGIALFWMGNKQDGYTAGFLFVFALTLRLVTYWYITEQYGAGLFSIIERNLMLILNTAILFFEVAVFMIEDGESVEDRISAINREWSQAWDLREQELKDKLKQAPPRPAKASNPDEAEKIRAMREAGKGWKEISLETGKSIRTCQRIGK